MLNKGLTIGKKIWLLVAGLMLVTALSCGGYQLLVERITQLGLAQSNNVMLKDYRRELHHLVDSVALTLGQAVASSGSPAQTEQIIRELLAPVRFGESGSGYFFAYTEDGAVVTVPPKPELQGSNLADAQDKKGNFFLRDLIAAAGRGGDFVEYYFEKPGQGVQPKLAYATYIPGTRYWVGTGVYIDDVQKRQAALSGDFQQTIRANVIPLMTAIGVVLVALLPLTWLLVRSVVRPVRAVESFAGKISRGELDTRLEGKFSGELANLKSSLEAMAASLKERADIATAIAKGDLSKEVRLVSERDVFGRALRDMVINLNGMLGNVQSSAEQIAAGSGQVADASQNLSQGATEQASSLEEISATMNEMSSQTRAMAENAEQADNLAGQARSAAEGGSAQMQEMVQAMDAISGAGQSISKIIKVIDEIAFQTNLLALNAAVEAARAGAHGKGFAVVAEEVRTLAARSAKAARETAELIESSVQKTDNGTAIAGRTAAALDEIVASIARVTDLVGEIANASKEQAEGIGQVNEGLSQVDQVTQQNTATAEESASAAEELSGQAEQLRQALGRFRLQNSSGLKGQPPTSQLLKAASHKTGQPAWGGQPALKEAIALDDDEFGRY